MKLLNAQNNINELMSVFVAQLKGASAMGRTDINRVSETFLIPLLSEVYNYKNLKNLNYTEGDNYPGIDLGDEEARVSFQITSTATIDKIKDSLRKFIHYELFKKYDKLFFYILTEKQKSYSGESLSEIVQDKFSFDPDKHILDYRDILREVSNVTIEKALKIQNHLELNLIKIHPTPANSKFTSPQLDDEVLHLNLLELSFPDTLYTAEILPVDVNDVFGKDVPRKRRPRRKPSPREAVRKLLATAGLKFSVDWEYFDKKIITFHDLNDNELPLSKVIDVGTITPLTPSEYCDVDESHERTFKSLLRRCLQQQLYHRDVHWQNDRALFIFSSKIDRDNRIEKWIGKKRNERTVFEITRRKDNPSAIWYCKHLAFEVQFKQISDKWYLLIKPDWYFSADTYRESFYSSDKVDWLKKNESNIHVYNHLQFIVYFLKNELEIDDLFPTKSNRGFLSFGTIQNFPSVPGLDDKSWNPPKEHEEAILKLLQMPLEL